MLFAIYKMVLFENRVMRIMFGIETVEIGRKGCIMLRFHNLYCLSDAGISKNSGKCVRNVACVGMMVIEIDF